MTLLSLVLISTGCEDKIDSPAVNPSEGETVEVSLNIGLADEADGYTLEAGTTKTGRSAGKDVFDVTMEPSATTKSGTAKPDRLYNLEIVQYDNNGTCKGRTYVSGETAIGSRLNITLTPLDDCQLVIVAWGQNNSTTLGQTSLSAAQGVTIDASIISPIDVDMNKMPYVLHLEHVCIKDNTIKSIEGEDVRLLLRRLATRLTLNWTYSYSDYELKQIQLHSIPLDYKVVAAPDKTDKTYPSLLDQYTTVQLNDAQITAGTYSCWIPANVRGTNPAATSQTYRIKSNAPTGSSYVDFIASNRSDRKKKLSYRVYLGGSKSSDFNLYSNTDYDYTVKIAHTGLPVNDRRVTIIDPIAASESNNNLVPTANCFMVAPGGAFCFNPYIYYVNGAPTPNSLLQGWCATTKIQSVRVLWQTKENGDVGDPVLGVVNSSTDHENIVDLTGGDSFENARIYCRVAPNTSGGNGVIAAYDGANGTGNILWSWHIWVTDYNPVASGNTAVLTPESKRKLVYKQNGVSKLPMMDRNLGAIAGYVTVPRSELDRSKANGLMYQWGRKDPFRSSYTNEKMTAISVPGIIDSPLVGILSCYLADGITFAPLTFDFANRASYQGAYRSPESMYKPNGNGTWISERNDAFYNSWGQNGNKGLHDPCPEGWRVCAKEDYYPLYTQANTSGILHLVGTNNGEDAGGYLCSYNEDDRTQGSYFRLTGYWMGNRFGEIGAFGYFWTRDNGKAGTASSCYPLRLRANSQTWNMGIGGVEQEALLIRCIQEQ